MSFFFCPIQLEVGTPSTLEGEAAHHIGTVRRIKVGEEIQLQDPRGKRYTVRVDAVAKRSIVVTPLDLAPMPPAPAHDITLLQSLVSEQNIDLILQKATELGAARIVLFQSEHSPHTIPQDRLAHKLERWTDIVRNACEQSGRPIIPHLGIASSLADALEHKRGTLIYLDENGNDFHVSTEYTIVVGPEGGLATSEKQLLELASAIPARIGPYTLRSETAAIAGITLALNSRT